MLVQLPVPGRPYGQLAADTPEDHIQVSEEQYELYCEMGSIVCYVDVGAATCTRTAVS